MFPGAYERDSVAQIMAGSGQTTTFGELDDQANRYARLFRECGLQVGDHVAICAENHPEYLAFLWGAHYAGLLYTAISSRLGAEELGYIVEDSGARLFVLSARYGELAAELTALTPQVTHRFSLGGPVPGHLPLEEAVAAQPVEPVSLDAIAGRDMLYSSGTTGRPKGIEPRALEATVTAPHLITPVLMKLLGPGVGDVYLSPAPLYHAAPLRFCMGFQQLGATVVVMEKFTPESTLEQIAQRGVTFSQLVPTMFVRLLRLPAEARAGYDVSSLKGVIHAGAPCTPEVKRAMIDWLGPIVHEYYASTEGCGITWITAEQWLSHPGSVGRAILGQPRIVNGDSGAELPAGETGMVFFSDGPAFEYHNDPEKTRAAYDDRGWTSCGDIGHLDAEGFLYLTDRASFTIITGGVNVYPQEAENVLQSHPAVFDAAVFGIPDDEFGQRVHAVVQPASMPADPAAEAALEAELIAHCRAALADVKCPRSVHFRPELPRHDTGKLYKRVLKQEYEEAHRAAAEQLAR